MKKKTFGYTLIHLSRAKDVGVQHVFTSTTRARL